MSAGIRAEAGRVLQPLRPVLAPLRRRLVVRARRDRWTGPTQAAIHRETPIHVISEREFARVAATRPAYYRGRRGYISAAASIADELIGRRGLRTALELGPHRRPLIIGADVMERRPPVGLEDVGTILVHDATQVPWPIPDRTYDLFVALQVFEHLVGHQADAFLEVRRVARHAIVSLPVDWTMADPTDAHHQLSDQTIRSWFAPVEPTRVETGNPAPGKRVLYVFEDLPPVSSSRPAPTPTEP
jgi:hypothetical protein